MNENFQTFQGNSSCVFLFYRKKKKKILLLLEKTFLEASRVSSLQKIKIKIKTERERKFRLRLAYRKTNGRKISVFFQVESRKMRIVGRAQAVSQANSPKGQGGHPRLDYPGWMQTEPRLIATPFLQMHAAGMPLASWKHGRGSCPSCTFFDSIRYSYFSPVSNEENDGGRLVDQRHDPRLDPGR